MDDDFKLSAPQHEEIFSGKFSRNYQGLPIRTDTVLKQANISGHKLIYSGVRTPLFKLLGDWNSTLLLSYRISKTREKVATDDLCDVYNNIYDSWTEDYFDNHVDINKHLKDKTRGEVYKDLEKHFSRVNENFVENLNFTECLVKKYNWTGAESIVYYTTKIDGWNHLYGKKHYKVIEQVYNVEKLIYKIMDWIKEHEDYILIVNSDHGGQTFYGDDSIINHGLNIPGNEGFLFFIIFALFIIFFFNFF